MRILKEKIKYIITIAVASAFIFGFGIWFITKEPTIHSTSERRNLDILPEFSFSSLLSGEYMKEFENAAPDQFPLRETFRTIKAYAAKYIFLNKSTNNLYYADGHLAQLQYPMKENMISYAADRVSFLIEQFIKDTDAEIFLSVIPDKNAFLADQNGYLSMDYDKFASIFKDKTGIENYIDIKPLLSADDYYTTDTHWKQECIEDVAEYITESLGAEYKGGFTVKELENPFYGVLYGQASLNVAPDTIRYLTSEGLRKCVVTEYSSGMPGKMPVYNGAKLEGEDLYEIFLSGSMPFITIENPEATQKNEIIVFRDSFGSSLLPLMATSFSKITIIDTRYVQPHVLNEFVKAGYLNFNSADSVLFIYSTVLLNDSLGINQEILERFE